MWTYAAVLRSEAYSQSNLERFERSHLSIEPRFGIRSEAVCPAETGSDFSDVELSHPSNYVIQPVVFKMDPLA